MLNVINTDYLNLAVKKTPCLFPKVLPVRKKTTSRYDREELRNNIK